MLTHSLNWFSILLFIKYSVSVDGSAGRPNVIFILADDAGFNDFSFHGSPQIPTPNIDFLALNGMILNSLYGMALCTPTRGSIMTGKYPIHLSLQHYVITGGTSSGLPLKEKLLPEYLKELGYATHLVGKWHLGHASKLYTPTFRGFDSHFGYWLGKQDYYDHFSYDSGGFGYDFRKDLDVDYSVFGKYDTDLFTNKAVELIESNPIEKPLFLMVNHIAPHSANNYSPLQAPQESIDKFNSTIHHLNRRKYAGVMDKLDESVGEIVYALGKKGILDNTIIIFSSDNGGSPEGYDINYGSNYPLRGVKNTLWEGGTRLAGFIWSTLLPNRIVKDIFHVSDWLPTIYRACGGNVSNLGQIDGLNQWDNFIKMTAPARHEFLYNIDDIYNNSAIRIGPYKLIQGNTSPWEFGSKKNWDGWYGPSGRSPTHNVSSLVHLILKSKSANAFESFQIPSNDAASMKQIQKLAELKCNTEEKNLNEDGIILDEIDSDDKCDPYIKPCLFNIQDDPCETRNLAQRVPGIVQMLLEKLKEYNKTALDPIPRITDPLSMPKFNNYVWTNWLDKVGQS